MSPAPLPLRLLYVAAASVDPQAFLLALGLGSQRELLSHPVVGGSWEGWIIENLIACAPPGAQASYYRTAVGAE